ncbi:hypothetical protein Tco_0563489 [Tanacetum coccineum]
MSFVVAGLYNSSVGLLWRPSLQHLLNSHIVVTSIAATQLHGKSMVYGSTHPENDDDEEWLPLDILEALKELRDRKIFDTEDMYTIADAWGWTWEMEIRNSPPRRWSQEWEVELEMAVKLMRKVIDLGGRPTIGDCAIILRAAIRAPYPSAFLDILGTTHSLGYVFGSLCLDLGELDAAIAIVADLETSGITVPDETLDRVIQARQTTRTNKLACLVSIPVASTRIRGGKADTSRRLVNRVINEVDVGLSNISTNEHICPYLAIETIKHVLELRIEQTGCLLQLGELTNWTPVSLRMPTPAEAKLAPTSNFLPLRYGLKYGNVASSQWLDLIFDKITLEMHV